MASRNITQVLSGCPRQIHEIDKQILIFASMFATEVFP